MATKISTLLQAKANQIGTFTASFSGPFASPQNVTIAYQKEGNYVTLAFPALSSAGGPAGQINASATSVLPVGFRPLAVNFYQPIVWTVSAGNEYTLPGVIFVDSSSGSIYIYKGTDFNAFATSGANGWRAFTVKFRVA